MFETILVKTRPVLFKQHFERMKLAIEKLEIHNSVSEEYLIECIEKYNIKNCTLKVIVTEKNTILSTRPIAYKEQDYTDGFNLKLSTLKRNPYSHVTYFKTLNFTDNIVEKERASKEGYDEAIFFNVHNKLAEGCVSNIFFVKDGKIHTPTIECGILNGIVRRWVIENFNVSEGEFSLEVLNQADEVFITNSIMGIMKVNSIDRKRVSRDIGIYTKIREKYEKSISQ